MNRFSITFRTDHPVLCPSCGVEIDDRNVTFWGDIAFCQRCTTAFHSRRLRDLAELVCLFAPTMYMVDVRGLFLFAPDERPIRPTSQCFSGALFDLVQRLNS